MVDMFIERINWKNNEIDLHWWEKWGSKLKHWQSIKKKKGGRGKLSVEQWYDGSSACDRKATKIRERLWTRKKRKMFENWM